MSVLAPLLASHAALLATIIVIFSVASIVLAAVANVLQAMGKQEPGILGKAISAIGSVLHFLNASTPVPVVAPVASTPPSA